MYAYIDNIAPWLLRLDPDFQGVLCYPALIVVVVLIVILNLYNKLSPAMHLQYRDDEAHPTITSNVLEELKTFRAVSKHLQPVIVGHTFTCIELRTSLF
ncbi:predicted protein [Lichtheimia corymbifera JMRC:FSU:9682]|uniref:Uncharacterized protein n=1 Tax=Lichtheimia corymbifera JMRC:FSU:9682 TaxID=1263082 RepID=A0A068S4L6_9FUNG|nr:predicted protein [Lichtheimia corymbifera JMRC:FSU:9682]